MLLNERPLPVNRERPSSTAEELPHDRDVPQLSLAIDREPHEIQARIDTLSRLTPQIP